jgi:hypothetical protein
MKTPREMINSLGGYRINTFSKPFLIGYSRRFVPEYKKMANVQILFRVKEP